MKEKGEDQAVFSGISMDLLPAHTKVTEVELSECIMSK